MCVFFKEIYSDLNKKVIYLSVYHWHCLEIQYMDEMVR